MPDLYRMKVYHNSTDSFADATYLQDTYITLNFTSPANTGVLINNNGTATELFSIYADNGYFDLHTPYLFNSDFNNNPLFSVLNVFGGYIADGIDVKNIISVTAHYFYITTDNSEYYISFSVKLYNASSVYMSTSNEKVRKKSDNSQVSNVAFSIGCAIGESTSASSVSRLLFLTGENHLRYLIYADGHYSYKLGSDILNPSGSNGWHLLLTNDTPYVPITDPYAGAGDSTTDGGDGTFDGSSDPVPVPSLPSVGATDTGFITLFVPTRAQLKQVAEYMWGGLFDVSTWKRLFEDPMDCILGLSVVPVTVPATASGNITVGNIELSGISLPIADHQYVEVDCGTIDFTNRFFGSYLDFEPYTKMCLFVPYSGVHSVSADDIIGKVVGLKYHIDILTGSLVAFLTCGDSVLYEFNGACASNIPVNSMNYASTIENAIRIAVNIGTTVATAGASAPVQGISQAQQTARNIGTGISLAGSTTEGALSLKPNIDRAGSLGGTTGLMGNQIPYFIITRPRLCKPKNQDFFQGYPSFIQTTIGDLIGKGFTSFTNIIIAESFMTDAENEELETILQGGVYL